MQFQICDSLFFSATQKSSKECKGSSSSLQLQWMQIKESDGGYRNPE